MNSCIFDYVANGYVIHFQTRGLTDVETTNIWQKLSPIRIKEYIEETVKAYDALVMETIKKDLGGIVMLEQIRKWNAFRMRMIRRCVARKAKIAAQRYRDSVAFENGLYINGVIVEM